MLDALRGEAPLRLPPRGFALPLLLLVAWEGASLAWSESATEGAKALAFYALPFGVLLAALVAHPPPRPRLPDLLRVQVVARARIRGGRRLPAAPPRHLVEPQADGLERVQLVLPRQLGLLRPVDLRPLPRGDDRAAVRRRSCSARCAGRSPPPPPRRLAWIGILTSYSQSAFVALCAAVGAGLVLAFGRRLAWLLLLGALLVGLALLAVPSVRDSGVDRVTSERSQLVGDGLRLFRDHPLAGVGLGGSTEAAREQTPRGRALRRAQHVMPLTVASELGIVGLVLVGWLLTALARLALGRGGLPAGAPRARPGAARDLRPLALLRGLLRGSADLGPGRAARRLRRAWHDRGADDRRPEQGAGARPAHRRRRVRLRRRDGAARRGRRRRAPDRVLDRLALAAGGLRGRHARARVARRLRGARPGRRGAHACTTSRCARSRRCARRSSSC